MSGSNTSVRFLGEAAVLRAVIDVACSGNRCRELLAREGRDLVVTRGSTYENRANLAPGFFDQVIRKYEGTRLGRQELEAELLEDIPGALWTRALIEAAQPPMGFGMPDLRRIVVAL